MTGYFDAKHFRGGPGGNWFGNYTSFDGKIPDKSEWLDDGSWVSEYGAPNEI